MTDDAIVTDTPVMEAVEAPFTEDQVVRLNEFQRTGARHPFTCPTSHAAGRDLIATVRGWICPFCDYTQNWAHSFMAEGSAAEAHKGMVARPRTPSGTPSTEEVERDIRIAIWNAAMNGGMGQDLSQAFIRRAMDEPTMKRAIAALCVDRTGVDKGGEQGVAASPPGHQPAASAPDGSSQSGVPNAVEVMRLLWETWPDLDAPAATINSEELRVTFSHRFANANEAQRKVEQLERDVEALPWPAQFLRARAETDVEGDGRHILLEYRFRPAQGGEARQGGDSVASSVHEHPVPEGDAPNPSPSTDQDKRDAVKLAEELESKMRARRACRTEAAADTFTHEIGLLVCGAPETVLTALRQSSPPVLPDTGEGGGGLMDKDSGRCLRHGLGGPKGPEPHSRLRADARHPYRGECP